MGHFSPRKRLPHDIPYWIPDGNFFFISINCALRGTNQLCYAGRGDAVLKAAEFYHLRLRWHCRLMLLMPDHVHAIIAFPQDATMRMVVRQWKRYLSRFHRISWQGDFFDHRLRNHHEEAAKRDYILKNPVRPRLCERIEEWPWVYHPTDRLPPRLGY